MKVEIKTQYPVSGNRIKGAIREESRAFTLIGIKEDPLKTEPPIRPIRLNLEALKELRDEVDQVIAFMESLTNAIGRKEPEDYSVRDEEDQ